MRTASYLNSSDVREIVAFDHERRAGRKYDGRRYGSVTGERAPRFVEDGTECFGVNPQDVRNGVVRKGLSRKTLRYNYIIRDGEGRDCDITVLHVAVRLDRRDRPVVKDVGAFFTRTGKHLLREIGYIQVSGWRVCWRQEDINGEPCVGVGAGRIANGGAWNESRKPWKCGRGIYFPSHETVNVSALKGTRFEYCRYADRDARAIGLVDWLMLYRSEPKVELLAKAGLFSLISPHGLSALRERAVFDWVRAHTEDIRRHSEAHGNLREIIYAVKHGVSIKAACRHFRLVEHLRPFLSRVRECISNRYNELHGSYVVPRGKGLTIKYDRLERLLPKWQVDAEEYARWLEFAVKAGMDWRNEGALYPPTGGGRQAFMDRLEAMERDCERRRRRIKLERRKQFERLLAERAVEIDEFQRSLLRTKTLGGAGYRIVLAKTQEELLAEGKRMHNCVGMGHYGERIAQGGSLIVMLRLRDGRSYCDIEIDRRSWRVVQCYLRRNEAPPEEIKSLAHRIAERLKLSYARMRRRSGARRREGRTA